MQRIYISFFCLIITACSPSEESWVELFNGKDLEGWHAYGEEKSIDGWYAENGELVFDFTKRKEGESSNLITDKAYTNFEFSIEWKISQHGNSGIFWGVVENEQYDHPYQTGPEVQILDDDWTEYVEGRGDINRAGALYGLMAPSTIVSKAAGVWNHYLIHIDHNANIGYVIFNDHEVTRFPVHGPEWEAMIAKSGFADWPGFGRAKTGHISLQDHGGTVAFRNIKIKILQ